MNTEKLTVPLLDIEEPEPPHDAEGTAMGRAAVSAAIELMQARLAESAHRDLTVLHRIGWRWQRSASPLHWVRPCTSPGAASRRASRIPAGCCTTSRRNARSAAATSVLWSASETNACATAVERATSWGPVRFHEKTG